MSASLAMSTLPAQLLATGFLNPILLGGIGLAVVPIIIHFLSRRRYRRIEWGATRFLLEAEKENRRRVRFEQWLLLALRCLAMALLALLVARPFVQPGALAALLGGGLSVQRIVILDDSASLGFRVGSGVEFEQIRSAAVRLLTWLQQEAPGDPVSLFLTSAPNEPLVADARLDPSTLAQLTTKLAARTPSCAPAHPAQVLTPLAEKLAADAFPGRTDIYLFSDFQRRDWLTRGEPDASVFEPLARLVSNAGANQRPADIRLILVASGVASRPNLAVASVEFERPQVIAGMPALVSLQIANFGLQPARDVVVRPEIDGAPLPAVPVDAIEAGAVRHVTFEATLPDAGFHELSASIGPLDGLAADDVHRIAVRVKDALSVLIVNGQPAADPLADETHLLRSALAPPGPFSSGLRVEVIDPSEIEGANLAAYDCVALCNVPKPDSGAADTLRRFVRSGGGLVMFLGSEIGGAEEYNAALYGDGDGVLPAPLERLIGTAEARGVGLVRIGEHPVTALFPAGSEALSEYVHFRQFYRCAEPAGATVLARFTDAEQSPALIERRFGAGRTLLFASSADLDWNDWARSADGSYVVTMLETMLYVARRDAHPRSFLGGQRLTLPISPDDFEPTAALKSPAYPEDPALEISAELAAVEPGEEAVLRGPAATRLGTWRIELRPRGGEVDSRPLCVNLDPTESDLAPASTSELDAALTDLPHEILPAAENFLRSDEQARQELWPAILLLLVAVLLGEQSLAWWFGRTETAPRIRSVGSRA